MITARFPNGQAVQYNNANYLSRNDEYSDLYTKKGGRFIAQIPNTCIIEYVKPCEVYNPLHNRDEDRLSAIEKEIRSINRKLKTLK